MELVNVAQNFQFPTPAPQIPIIGSAFELVQFWPSAIMKCKCTEAGTVVVIIGQGETACASCGKTYRIDRVTFDRISNQLELRLGIAAPLSASLAGGTPQ